MGEGGNLRVPALSRPRKGNEMLLLTIFQGDREVTRVQTEYMETVSLVIKDHLNTAQEIAGLNITVREIPA
jgi:hypothetical protein